MVPSSTICFCLLSMLCYSILSRFHLYVYYTCYMVFTALHVCILYIKIAIFVSNYIPKKEMVKIRTENCIVLESKSILQKTNSDKIPQATNKRKIKKITKIYEIQLFFAIFYTILAQIIGSATSDVLHALTFVSKKIFFPRIYLLLLCRLANICCFFCLQLNGIFRLPCGIFVVFFSTRATFYYFSDFLNLFIHFLIITIKSLFLNKNFVFSNYL